MFRHSNILKTMAITYQRILLLFLNNFHGLIYSSIKSMRHQIYCQKVTRMIEKDYLVSHILDTKDSRQVNK